MAAIERASIFQTTSAVGRQILAALTSVLIASALTAKEPREQIGEALGKPVYRDEIQQGKNFSLRDELFRLVAHPAVEKYRQAHKAQIEPTAEEIEFAMASFDKDHRERVKADEPKLKQKLNEIEAKLAKDGLTKDERQKLEVEREVTEIQLKPPGRFFAEFILNNWKFQRHLYDQFGGGRILWQQAGLEAFDATHKWLESLEAKGEFKFTDPKLRASFYEYWTTMKHGSFLFDDKEQIREQFLEPPWALKRAQSK